MLCSAVGCETPLKDVILQDQPQSPQGHWKTHATRFRLCQVGHCFLSAPQFEADRFHRRTQPLFLFPYFMVSPFSPQILAQSPQLGMSSHELIFATTLIYASVNLPVLCTHVVHCGADLSKSTGIPFSLFSSFYFHRPSLLSASSIPRPHHQLLSRIEHHSCLQPHVWVTFPPVFVRAIHGHAVRASQIRDPNTYIAKPVHMARHLKYP